MNKLILIFLILILAFTLRFWEFGKIPAGIYVDEGAHGYNSYSLLKTGKDEYGKQFPILMRSFGTYSSALYDYLTTIPMYFLGLNEVSVRLVSLISGMVLVGMTIWQFGMLTGLVVAIAPIFVFTSRAAYEPNLGLGLLVLGSVLAFKASKNPKLLLLSYPILSLSAYGYHAERFLGAVVTIFFLLKYWRKKIKTLISISCLLALIIQIPLFSVSFTEGAYVRLSGLSSEATILERSLSFPRMYLAYFAPNNLFSKPDPDPQRSFVDLSVFYWWMFIPFIFGIFAFLKERSWKEITGQYLLVLLIFSPILGALTKDYFSTLRVMPLFLGISWLIAQGLKVIVRYKFIYLILVFISVLELYPNLVLLKYEKSSIWNYEYKSLFGLLNDYKGESIVIDNTRSKPVYILEAFYNEINPRILQSRFNKQHLESYYSQTYFENNFRIENIEYRPIYWKDDAYRDQILVGDLLTVSDDQAKEHKLKLLHDIYNISNQVVLRVFSTNPKEKCVNFDPQVLDLREKCLKILDN